jgi:hypothetical protein
VRGRGHAVRNLIERDSGGRGKTRRPGGASVNGVNLGVPADDEAGRLGVSIQAIRAYDRAAVAAEEFAAIVYVCDIDAGGATAQVAGASPPSATPCPRRPLRPDANSAAALSA